MGSISLFVLVLGVTVCVVGGCAHAASPVELPAGALGVYRTEKPITLDGKFDEPAWQRAIPSPAFVARINRTEKELADDPVYATTVRALHDGSTLYVAFECQGPPPWADRTQRDDKLYEQDVAEIFLDFVGDMKEYAEFHMSPNGVVGDAYHTWDPPPTYPAETLDWDQISKHTKMDGAWQLDGLTAAGRALDAPRQGWAVEVAVPLAPLLEKRGLKPTLQRGQVLKGNFIRYIYILDANDKRQHNQMTWKSTIGGCPHVSPMANGSIVIVD